MRIERDSFGEIAVAEEVYWGAQTQRSLENFKIGEGKMPIAVIYGLAEVKAACAKVSWQLGRLDEARAKAIIGAAEEITNGKLDDNFPLRVYQTGSGTQSNMNVNEVIAHRANELLGEDLVHPNDHVNRSQSSNDTFPTAMHLAAYKAIREGVLPELGAMIEVLEQLVEQNTEYIKIGRTHLQDATPISFAQEISGWLGMMQANYRQLSESVSELLGLAIGGTAVGTGLNAPEGFGELVAKELAEKIGYPFYSAANKFHALSSKDALVYVHGALKSLAANAMKFANDVRWLASGPRSGLGEITIPANEPGSSIMPGKINPTQAEALTMVAVTVMGNDAAIGIAASQGNFELNVFMPVIIDKFLESATLLSAGLESFRLHCVSGIRANPERMAENLERSLMLVTALAPEIGYELAAKAAKYAHEHKLSLLQACLELQLVSEEEFKKFVRPEEMI
ncbi:MAG: class II fumarate hydratase [Eubacteriales bacterium]|nr:class II fumarate hydratase [Eubacteriales bacterium]